MFLFVVMVNVRRREDGAQQMQISAADMSAPPPYRYELVGHPPPRDARTLRVTLARL